MKIIEKFSFIARINNIDIFDSNHAREEFNRWFPSLSWDFYLKSIKSALDKVGKDIGNYMINSKSTGLRIPLEIREDRIKKGKIIGVIPTTLNASEIYNVRNDVNIFVENNKNEYKKFPIVEGFSFYSQRGTIFEDFESVEVE